VTDLAAANYPYVPVRWLLLDRFDTRGSLGRIHVPVLIFHSTDDPTVPFAMGQELARRLGSRATFVKMTGMGHIPHQTDLSATVAAWAKTKHLLD
jgi:pimeloyl-ACP methyl ester carboxylesterase